MSKGNRITVHMARPHEGERIRDLLTQSEYPLHTLNELDWSDVYPDWAVARRGDEVIGCIQVSPTRPIGRIECMGVDKDLSNFHRALVVHRLTEHALSICFQAGVQLVSGTVPFGMKHWMRVLKRHGAVKQVQGNVFVRRIA